MLGDALFEGLPGLPSGLPILMREDAGLATRVRHHRQKLILVFSAMRHLALREKANGRSVVYRKWGEDDGFGDILQMLSAQRPKIVHAYAPNDRFFDRALRDWAVREGVELRLVPSPMFLTSERDWLAWRRDQCDEAGGRMLMGDFYAFQRERLGLLLDGEGRPLGGRWSHDAENRRPLPRVVLPPPVPRVEPDAIAREVMAMVDREFRDHPGYAADFGYAVTPEGARGMLAAFVAERLERFGPYEDAIPQRERTLFHSVLSPYLNIGLLTPAEVVAAVEGAWRERGLPLNSVEGFLRQGVGWREFVFWTDREYGARGWGLEAPYPNALGASRRLAPCWWEGTTGLPPLDTAIRRAQAHGWLGHIERLMVVGAAMTMSGVHPDEMFRWFMELFVDSAEWVMAPNVYGMSAWADGGTFATKPYVSGSAYLRRMGGYARGAWCEVWDGLYWSFLARYRERFAPLPRMAESLRGLERLEPRRRERLFAAAEGFIARATLAGS